MLEALRKVNIQDDPTIDLIAALAAGNAITAECVALNVRTPTWISDKLTQLRTEIHYRKQIHPIQATHALRMQVGQSPDKPF